MDAKWRVRSLRVKGQNRWLWRAIGPQSVDAIVPSLSMETFLFRTQPAALAYALQQIEESLIVEATA